MSADGLLAIVWSTCGHSKVLSCSERKPEQPVPSPALHSIADIASALSVAGFNRHFFPRSLLLFFLPTKQQMDLFSWLYGTCDNFLMLTISGNQNKIVRLTIPGVTDLKQICLRSIQAQEHLQKLSLNIKYGGKEHD